MNLIAIGLSLLAVQVYAGTIGGALPQVLMAQEEPRYPIGGTFFTGSSDALIKLRDFARQKGFVLEIITLPDGSQRLLITSALLFDKAFPDVFNEAQSGRLGNSNLALFPAPRPLRLSEDASALPEIRCSARVFCFRMAVIASVTWELGSE